jgi:hypothetical protein
MFYDPDHKGNVTRLQSLGVHEHWNNPVDKQYSRNLGTGKGIELIKLGRVVRRAAAGHSPDSIRLKVGYSSN